jgi:hypothetical protein
MYDTTSVSKYTTFWEFFLQFEKEIKWKTQKKTQNLAAAEKQLCRGREPLVPVYIINRD